MDFEHLNETLAQSIQQFNLPACGVGIASHDQTMVQGYGDYDDNWVFPLCSISKSFLATTICQLADQGVLDLDQPIIQSWNQFKVYDDYATKHLTWRDLLCHRSGVPAHDLMRFTNGPLSLSQVITKVPYLKPNVDLRYKMQYSNLMFAELTFALEQVLGTDYYSYLQQHLLTDLNLTNTYVHDEAVALEQIAPAYLPEGSHYRPMQFMSPGHLGGASSMLAQPQDLLTWAQFQLQNYQQQAHNNAAQMYQPQIVMQPSRNYAQPQLSAYGFGMMMETYRGYKYFYHTGSFIGYCAILGFVPELDLAFGMVTNLDSTNAMFGLAYQVIDQAAQLAEVDWTHKILQDDYQKASQKKQRLQQQFGATKTVISSRPEWLGVYVNPGYGRLELCEEQGQLHIKFAQFDFAVVTDLKGQAWIDIAPLNKIVQLNITPQQIALFAETALSEPIIFSRQ